MDSLANWHFRELAIVGHTAGMAIGPYAITCPRESRDEQGSQGLGHNADYNQRRCSSKRKAAATDTPNLVIFDEKTLFAITADDSILPPKLGHTLKHLFPAKLTRWRTDA